MTESAALSARSVLIAGVAATVVGAAVVTPVNVPAVSEAKITAIATQLTSATTPIEEAIKNTYNAIEPWAAYGAELGQWALSLIPGLWWIAPGIDFAYFTIEPLVQAGVYTFADVIGLNFAQIGPDITSGINQSVDNAVIYGLAWLSSLVPLPPFPPLPPRPGASVTAAAVLPAASTTVVAGAQAKSITTPIEVAIKNTYNAVEPWVAYGVQWVEYVAGLIPIVNWFTPAIGLAYSTIEPLFRAGTYAFADLIGLNFAAIGPDIWNGVTTSANNFVTGILNWANIPLPPLLPGAAVAAPPAASLRATASVAPAAAVAAPNVPSDAAAPGTGTTAHGGSAPADEAAPAVTPAEHSAPAAPVTANTVTETASPTTEATPATGIETPAAETAPPAVIELPAAGTGAGEAPQRARTAHRGPSASAASGGSDSASTPAKAGRHVRTSE